MKVLDLFSGIGGFSLGLERAGMETVAFCEIDPFCHKVLKKHWPNVPIYTDVKELTNERLEADGIFPDVITGGFPCQDLSVAGKQAGIDGERSGLWSELARIISEVRPRYAILENVTNLLSGPSEQRGEWFGRVLGDLAQIGYDAEWHCIPASAVGAPHQRDRAWIIANDSERGRCDGSISNKISEWLSRAHTNNIVSQGNFANYGEKRTEREPEKQVSGLGSFSWCKDVRRVEDYFDRSDIPEPLIRRYSDGLPYGVDRVGALGNSVVPQIPEIIGRAIMEVDR